MTHPLRVVVDSRVRVEGVPLVTEHQAVLDEYEHKNPDYWKAKRFGFRKRVPKVLATWRAEPGGYSVPRGGMGTVRSFLKRLGDPFVVEDRRTLGDDTLGAIPPHRRRLWPHQEHLVEVAVARQNALFRSAAASGKTSAALAFASRIGLPTLVVVHNRNLFDQWIDRCVEELGVPRSWVGIIQGARRRLGPITIGMQQTLAGCAAEVAPAFGCVIVDEVQRAASRTFIDVVDHMTAKYRLGVSDDERRSDGKEFLIRDMFGEVAGEADHDELVDAGYVMDVSIRVVPTAFRADWYVGLEDAKRALAFDALLAVMTTDPERNAIALRCVADERANGNQVIVFTHRVEHALDLDRTLCAAGLPSGFVVGEHKAESDETLRRFRDGRASVICGTYQALGTGVDLPKVSRGVFATPIANSAKGRSQFKQYRGRFARTATGKGDAVIYYLWDVEVFGTAPLRHLCRWARDVTVRRHEGWRPGRTVLKEMSDAEAK